MRTLILIAGIVAAAGSTPGTPATRPVHEIQITARKFAFEPASIEVTEGEDVRLILHSADALHGFAIKALNIDVDIPRGGKEVTVEFTAPAAGRYEIACSEVCGSGHTHMRAALVSSAPARTIRLTREERKQS